MGIWDIFRKKKPELAERTEELAGELLEVKASERVSLYGGLCELVAGHIVLAIAESMLLMAWEIVQEGPPRYSYAHDWTGKRRLSLFKWHFQRRKAWQRHNRNGRISLKKLGWRVINLKA